MVQVGGVGELGVGVGLRHWHRAGGGRKHSRQLNGGDGVVADRRNVQLKEHGLWAKNAMENGETQLLVLRQTTQTRKHRG